MDSTAANIHTKWNHFPYKTICLLMSMPEKLIYTLIRCIIIFQWYPMRVLWRPIIEYWDVINRPEIWEAISRSFEKMPLHLWWCRMKRDKNVRSLSHVLFNQFLKGSDCCILSHIFEYNSSSQREIGEKFKSLTISVVYVSSVMRAVHFSMCFIVEQRLLSLVDRASSRRVEDRSGALSLSATSYRRIYRWFLLWPYLGLGIKGIK